MLDPNDYDLSRDEWEQLIDQYIFSERSRVMLKRKMFDGITYEALAEEFELSTQRTKAIIGDAKTRLLRYIK